MIIAAFDLGTTWAYASNFWDHPEPVHHGVLGGKDAKRPEKLAHFTLALQAILVRDHDVLVYERPFARGQAATRLLWGMAGILEAAAHTYETAVLDITPSEIKKWSTGSGKADKDAMIVAAKRLGYDGDNEHEADAYCLLKFSEATLTKGNCK